MPSIYLVHHFGSMRVQIRVYLTHKWCCSLHLRRNQLQESNLPTTMFKAVLDWPLLRGYRFQILDPNLNSLRTPVFYHPSIACILTHY